MERPYEQHAWIATEQDGAWCMKCGIDGDSFDSATENEPMIYWDCYAVRERNDDV